MARSETRRRLTTGQHFRHYKRNFVRISFGLIVFSLLLVSFLLGRYTSEEDDSWVPEQPPVQQGRDWKKELVLQGNNNIGQDELSMELQTIDNVTYNPVEPTSSDLVSNNNTDSQVESISTTQELSSDLPFHSKQWDNASSKEQQYTGSSFLLDYPNASSSLSFSLDDYKEYTLRNLTYQEPPVSANDKDGNIPKSLERNVSITPELAESLDTTSGVQMILTDTIQSEMERDSQIAKIRRCFDIYKFAKHEVLADVQISSIIQQSSSHSILLLFHGCKHSAQDWFLLPEEVSVVCEALERNFSVVAFSSEDRWSGCWDSFYPAIGNKDVVRVSQSLEKWTQNNFGNSTCNLRWYALGVSSGGSFLSILSTWLQNISAQAIYISPGSFSYFTWSDWNTNYPPTCFVHMSRDTSFGSYSNVKKSCDLLNHSNIPCHIFSLEPYAITPDLFHTKNPSISLSFSRHLVDLLHTTKWLDEQGYLVENPSKLNYSYLCQSDAVLERSCKTFQTSIQEILNRAYGVHEMASDYFDQILDWFIHVSHNKEP